MGQWSLVLPETSDVTNLITNPSAETGTTGWTAGAGTLARVASQQRRGAWCLSYTPTATTTDGFYFGTVSLTNGVTYTASFDVKGVNGVPYQIYFASTAPAALGTPTTFTGTGEWQRVTVTWAENAGASRRLYIAKNSSASTGAFYVDGALCWAGSYDLTYFDGDSRGFVDGQFYWTGTPHASTSVMLAGTRAGGRVVDMGSQFAFYVRQWLGVGLAGLSLAGSSTPLIGGGVYQRTNREPRTFALVGTLMGTSQQTLQSYRQALINAVKPDATAVPQPVTLRYQGSAGGTAYGDPLDVQAVFEGGLEGGETRGFTEEMALKFRLYMPYTAVEDGTEGASLTYQTSIASADYLIGNINGTWQKFGTAPNSYINGAGLDPVTGDFYIGGNFTTVGGVTVNYGAKYTRSTAAWSAMGTGFNNTVTAIAFGPNGYPYFVGAFTTANAVSAIGAAYWNGSTFVALATSGAASPACLAFDSSGNLYVGGSFTSINGVAAARVAMHNGSTWSALGAGIGSGTVRGLGFGGDGYLYATNDSATYRYSGGTWTSIGGPGMYNSMGWYRAPDGSLYVSGSGSIQRWNGASWASISGLSASNYYGRMTSDKWGNIVIPYTVITTSTQYDYILVGGYPNVYDYTYSAVSTGNYGVAHKNGTLIAWGSRTGTVTAAGLTSVTNNGSQKAFPTLRFTGPGTVYNIRSYTTGDAIYFNLTLLSGEVAYLDLTPGAIRFYSNFRANLISTILPGSNLATFGLMPGANSISVFVGGTTDGNTAAWMYWRRAHWSLDGGS